MWETYMEIDSNRREGGRESDIDVKILNKGLARL